MMKQISLHIVLMCTTFVALSDALNPECPNGEKGLLPDGSLCNGRNMTSCNMFPDHVCYAPWDAGVCCPSSSSGITCGNGSIGRYLGGGQHCNAFAMNSCSLYPNHYCPWSARVCCPIDRY